jgi:hypothetical protein
VDVLRGDQDIDLLEKPFQALLKLLKEPFSLPVVAGDNFNLDDIVNEIYTAVLPGPYDRVQFGN